MAQVHRFFAGIEPCSSRRETPEVYISGQDINLEKAARCRPDPAGVAASHSCMSPDVPSGSRTIF